MALKIVVDTLDDVEEQFKSLYKEFKIKDKDGKERTVLALDVEGDAASHPGVTALRNAFERQKADNATLKTRVGELEQSTLPDGVTVEEIERLQAFEAEVKRNDPNDPEKKNAHQAEIQSVKTQHAQEVDRLKKKRDADVKDVQDKLDKANAEIKRLVVDEGLTKALVEAGVQPHFLKASKAMLAKSVKVVVDDDGTSKAVVATDLGDTDVGEFVHGWAKSDEGKPFIAPPSGSDAKGSDRGGPGNEVNPFTKANWNMTAQGQLMAKDAAKADRLAKAAGHRNAETADEANAK